MRYFLVTAPMRQKDGSEVVETQLLHVSEAEGAPTPEELGIDPETAVEVPRPPRDYERWDAADGAWVEDLASLETELLAGIDEAARLYRLGFLTSLPAQQTLYLRKEALARAWLAERKPVAADYPLLALEAAATGQSINAVATGIVAQADAATARIDASDCLRVAAKRRVRTATTAKAKRAAAAIEWPE